MRNRRHAAIFLFAGLVLSGKSASAARLIHVTFEHDDRVVLETYYQDGGLADAATVWRYLGRKPIMIGESPLGVASTGDPMRADLDGKVTISVLHADRLIARANVSGLTLVRGDPSDTQWFLPGDEVERTARAAGLGPAASPAIVWSWWIALGMIGFLCLSFRWFALRLRYKGEPNGEST
jgi:hypothetical protein